ncbi:hypothetical protein [Paracoccus thiocyanatus]|uniref:hypothetical protein n=1 Tax=Paracoccus thiocyanatus TaxID=34006 RepID=UPI0011C045D6|nr:hypothetical protein [Paracoccus thiocyanatus]
MRSPYEAALAVSLVAGLAVGAAFAAAALMTVAKPSTKERSERSLLAFCILTSLGALPDGDAGGKRKGCSNYF